MEVHVSLENVVWVTTYVVSFKLLGKRQCGTGRSWRGYACVAPGNCGIESLHLFYPRFASGISVVGLQSEARVEHKPKRSKRKFRAAPPATNFGGRAISRLAPSRFKCQPSLAFDIDWSYTVRRGCDRTRGGATKRLTIWKESFQQMNRLPKCSGML